MSHGSQEAGRQFDRMGLLVALAVFAIAILPRMLAADVYVTSDEDSWMRRAGGFAYGVSHGLLGRTYQNGHPGVTTMELAILGQGPGGAERFADPITGARLVTRVPGFFEGLVEARRAFIVVSSGLVVLIAFLTWRLLGSGPAIAAAVLLAFDPWLIAHAQLVHTDGLLAGLSVGSVLSALVWAGERRRGWLVLSGCLAGLALLSKVPALFLGLYVPLIVLCSSRGRQRLRATVLDGAVWTLAVVATFLALWPSMWVRPRDTLERMAQFARLTGGEPDEVGSFFLGQVWGDPGPLFYPVALAFRATPVEMFGLAALGLLIWPMRRLLNGRLWSLVALILFGIGFVIFVGIGQKKFDRYVLPAQPILLILAALGWWLLFRRLRPFMVMRPAWLSGVLGISLLAAIQAREPASVYPYAIAYFNPLLGGGPAAARTVMVGNGEGMDQVAGYFNEMPNVDQIWVASHSYDLLAARCRCDGEPLRERAPSDADYVVVYGRRIQLRRWGAGLDEYLATREPVKRIWINGIEMARIYPGPKQERQPPG